MQHMFNDSTDNIGVRGQQRVIEDGRAKKFCDDFMNCNWNYFETCATYGFNVEQTFSERK